MPQRELCFVNLSGTPDEDAQAVNKVVRSHVMRQYRQQQRRSHKTRGQQQQQQHVSRSDSQKDSQSREATASSASSSSPSFPSPASSGGRTRGSLSPVTWLDGELNPFSCLPISNTPRAMMLLQHNITASIRTSVHADPDSLYRKVCSANPAWILMNLFYASCRFPREVRERNPEDQGYLVGAISGVRESIAKSPCEVEDSTLATVSSLANIQNLIGQASHAAVHMDGLVRMVEVRGGLDKLGVNGLIRRMVLWSDLLTSIRSARAPRMPLQSRSQDMPHLSTFTGSQDSAELYTISPNPRLFTITASSSQTSVGQVLVTLHELCTFLNVVGYRALPWDAAYPERVYQVEHQILTCLHGDHLIGESAPDLIIGDLLLRASLLYIYTNLRETPVGRAVREALLERVQVALAPADTEALRVTFEAELLWVLLLCATYASSQEASGDSTFFRDRLRDLAVKGQYKDWSLVEKALKPLPVLESRYRNQCKAVWARIEKGNVSG